MTRHTLTVFIVGLIAMTATAVMAKDNVLERDNIETTYKELTSMISELEGAVTTAEMTLGEVKEMDIKEGRAATDTLFSQLKGEINGVLNGLALNSVLMDNLEGAKANVIVLKRWFERQPPNYPNRDGLIMRLDDTIQGYGELTELITTGRQDTQDALREVLRAQFYQSMARKVETAENSVKVTKRIVDSLQQLSTKIRKLAEQEIPQTIPN